MNLLITGVRSVDSIAWHAAEHAVQAGHTVLLTAPPSDEKRAVRAASRLSTEDTPKVVPFDTFDPDSETQLRGSVADHLGEVDGVLHAIAWAPSSCLGEDFFGAPWADVSKAMEASAYSFVRLARSVTPLMPNGGDLVALTFDAQVTWDTYNWMGVAKAALESTGRYLARSLASDGIRVNLVAAGVLDTLAASGIDGVDTYRSAWEDRSMMAWDPATAADPVGRTCLSLMTGMMPTTTGEIVHADAGLHAVGDYTNPVRLPRLNR